jgi:hypothetical protein
MMHLSKKTSDKSLLIQEDIFVPIFFSFQGRPHVVDSSSHFIAETMFEGKLFDVGPVV